MHRHLTYCLVCFLLLVASTCVPAQDQIYFQGFEGEEADLMYTPNVPAYGTGTLPTWNVVTRCKGITPYAGDYFWGVRDADNALSNTPVSTLSFDAGNICDLTAARFVFAYHIIGYDGGDDFGYELYLDGFLHERTVLVDGKNGGGVSTDGWVTDTVSIPGTAQTARLLLFFDQNGDDAAGIDNVQLLASGTGGNCAATCGIALEEPRYDCATLTDGADALTLTLPYRGAEAGVSVAIAGGTVGGDDPALVQDGKIVVSDLREGQHYRLTVTGGDCDLALDLAAPADQCAQSDVVINELLPDPAEDVNQDGLISPADEFVEIYNAGQAAVDLTDYSVHEGSNAGARFVFPGGSVLEPGESFIVLAGGEAEQISMGCDFGIARGFLGLNNNGPETVTLRDPAGRVVAQASYDGAPEGESLVLHPDGNLAGGYQPHTSVRPTTSSACASASLPVEVVYFTATAMTDAVRLDWVTQHEVDNDHFTVERSKGGVAFTPLGKVPAGDGTYVFVDTHPLPGQNLYRLRQRDLDGTETLYGPISVRLDSGTISLYPNPTAGKLFLTGEVDPEAPVTVYRSDGQIVHRAHGETINVTHLPAGSYYLRLRRGAGAESFRFIKE